MSGSVLLRNALVDGDRVDVALRDGRIASIDSAGSNVAVGASVVDLDGRLLLAAPVEPHAHLDKALTADAVPNPTGDLAGAITGWLSHRQTITVDEIVERATRAVLAGVANGVTAIRTHVDVGEGIGLRAAEALLEVRAALDHLVTIQVVALVGRPTVGPDGSENRRALASAVELGVDVVGGCPHIDIDPAACVDHCLDLAGEAGLALDLHMDENLRPDSLDVRWLAKRVVETGFEHGVVASHAVSLGMLTPAEQAEIAAELAAAGVGVVTLPQTNLYLQARDLPQATPRGLTALRALLDAGVVVAAGADNLQDPFNVVGRADPFETAALLVMAGHLDPTTAWRLVTVEARTLLDLAPVSVSVGSPADLVAVAASSLREAIASAPADRTVVRAGRVVARTMTERRFVSPSGAAEHGELEGTNFGQ